MYFQTSQGFRGIEIYLQLVWNKTNKLSIATVMMNTSNIFKKNLQYIFTRFFYKQHFYKQRQNEIGKKSSKC